MNPDMLGPATFCVTQGVVAYSLFLPKFTDVRRNNPLDHPDFAGDVRTGEVAATAVTLGVGAIASYYTGSPAPMATALFIAFIMVATYEFTLRANAPFEGPLVTIGDTANA